MMNTDAVPDRNTRYSSPDVMAAPMAPRLFGRAREHAALLSAYEAAETGKTVFLLIEGPAGIGKSALVADFRETLPNGTLFAAGRFEEPDHIPLSGLRQALSGAARHLLAQDTQPWLCGAGGSKMHFGRMAVLSAISCRSSSNSLAHSRR